METNEKTPAEPPMVTPPMEADALPPKASRWPTVIGVIAIIVASLGLAGGCCGMFSPFISGFFIDMAADSGSVPPEQIAVMRASQPPVVWVLFASLIGLGLSVLLLLGGIAIARRRANGATLCKVWSWINIPWAAIAFIISAYFQLIVPQDSQQMGSAFQYLGLALGGCFTLVVGIAFPLFMLYWFAKATIKDEIAAWEAESRAMI